MQQVTPCKRRAMPRATLTGLSFLVAGHLCGCAVPASGPAAYAGSQTYVPALPVGAVPGLGSINGLIRQGIATEQAQYRQQVAQQRAAEAKEARPHPASVLYVGILSPLSDVRSVVVNKTLYLQGAIVANHQLVRMDEHALYFSRNGKSYSSDWTDQPWSVQDNNLCINGKSSFCMPMFLDGNNEMFAGGPENMLLKVARVEEGDSANVRAAYAENQRNQQKRAEMTQALVGLFLKGMMSGGGGGSSSGSSSYDRSAESQSIRERDNRDEAAAAQQRSEAAAQQQRLQTPSP